MEHSQELQWRRAAIFSPHTGTKRLHVPWDDGDELYRIIAAHFGLDVSEIDYVHSLNSQPTDLIQDELYGLILQQREDFAGIEGGERVGFHDLHAAWVQHLSDMNDTVMETKIKEVPTLCALEAACRTVAESRQAKRMAQMAYPLN